MGRVLVLLALFSSVIKATSEATDLPQDDTTCALQLATSESKQSKQLNGDEFVHGNVWWWRKDLPISLQTSYNLSDVPDTSLYYSCNEQHIDTIDKPRKDGVTFIEFHGRTGISLFDKRIVPNKSLCFLRTFSEPIDLAQIGRIEMDVKTSGSGTKAPWFSVWLAPMYYSFENKGDVTGEINLVENHDGGDGKHGYNNVHTSFPSCNNPGNVPSDYGKGYCIASTWNVGATKVDHHITLTANDEGVNGRVIDIRRCNTSKAPKTCKAEEFPNFAELKATKVNPRGSIPVWKQEEAKEYYGRYQLVTNIWDTSGTDFELTVSKLRLFWNNGTEWRAPLDACR